MRERPGKSKIGEGMLLTEAEHKAMEAADMFARNHTIREVMLALGYADKHEARRAIAAGQRRANAALR